MKYLFFIIPFFFSACVNKCGVSSDYYNTPKEFYDSHGVYRLDYSQNDLWNWCNAKPKKESLADLPPLDKE